MKITKLKNITKGTIVFLVLMQTFMIPAWSIEKIPEKKDGFVFNEKQRQNRFFTKYFKVFDQKDQKQFPKKDSLLCIGSSSMLYWKDSISKDLAPLTITHRGFGGSTMGDVLCFKDFFLRYNADSIMIYEGDNDLWGSYSTDKFISNCKKFVKYIHNHKPETKIYFISVKPSIRRNKKWDKCIKGNALLKTYTETEKNLFYIDVASAMFNKDGSIMNDLFIEDDLHMNSKGYEIWTKVVREAFGLKKLEKFKLNSIKGSLPIKNIVFSTQPDIRTTDLGVLFNDKINDNPSFNEILLFRIPKKKNIINTFTISSILEKPSYLKSLKLHLLQKISWGIYFPSKITLSISPDGIEWEKIEIIPLPKQNKNIGFWAEFQIKKMEKIPSMIKIEMEIIHPKNKRLVFIAIDEIKIVGIANEVTIKKKF